MDLLEVISLLDRRPQPYRPVWDLQKRLWQERVEGTRGDTLILVEHQRVITLGRGFRREHLLASPVFLERMGFEVVEVERGGDVTYHGPGQLVAYPVFAIREKLAGVRRFVHRLEEVMIRVLAQLGVEAHRDPSHRGVFVGKDKIGAVGVAVRRWVAFHGFALYVAPPVEDFRWIVPCGLADYGITSVARLTGRSIPVGEVEEPVIQAFREVFGFDRVQKSSTEEAYA